MTKSQTRETAVWKLALQRTLPLFGHRNWIVVADAAYPAQSSPGIETIATGSDHLEVLKTTLDAIENSRHVRAKLYVDAEFKHVRESSSPGVNQYRKSLVNLIRKWDTLPFPHDQIIAKLDESSRAFRTLILKSTLTIPYSTVFLELDCGYWSQDAERCLRNSMTRLHYQQKKNLV